MGRVTRADPAPLGSLQWDAPKPSKTLGRGQSPRRQGFRKDLGDPLGLDEQIVTPAHLADSGQASPRLREHHRM